MIRQMVGRGKILPGTLIGAILIQMIQNGLVIIHVDPYIYPLATGAIIFLIVLVDSQRHFFRKQKLLSKAKRHVWISSG